MTEQQAAKHACPVARTFGPGKGRTCDGSNCILWRWRPMAAADNRYKSAIERQTMQLFEEAKSKSPDAKRTMGSFSKQAIAIIDERPWDFIFMTDEDRGYCGLGGKP